MGDTLELLGWLIDRLPEKLRDFFRWTIQDTIQIDNGEKIFLEPTIQYVFNLPIPDSANEIRLEDTFISSMVGMLEGYQKGAIVYEHAIKQTRIIQMPPIAIFRLIREGYNSNSKSGPRIRLVPLINKH